MGWMHTSTSILMFVMAIHPKADAHLCRPWQPRETSNWVLCMIDEAHADCSSSYWFLAAKHTKSRNMSSIQLEVKNCNNIDLKAISVGRCHKLNIKFYVPMEPAKGTIASGRYSTVWKMTKTFWANLCRLNLGKKIQRTESPRLRGQKNSRTLCVSMRLCQSISVQKGTA